jgi:predicted heme/steroid binding protein
MLPMSAHRGKADLAGACPKSKIQFNGVGGLPTYISFMQGADDMSDHDKWTSYSHWGMFLTGTNTRNNPRREIR